MLLEVLGGLAEQRWNLALSGNPLSPAERAAISLFGVREWGLELPFSLAGQCKRTGGRLTCAKMHKARDHHG